MSICPHKLRSQVSAELIRSVVGCMVPGSIRQPSSPRGRFPTRPHDPDCGSPFKAVYDNCTTPGQPMEIPGTPNTSMGMEAFQDSAVVNGTAFPSLTVDPRAYRFRILNAASDRFWNLSFYVADSSPGNISPDAKAARSRAAPTRPK